MSQNNWKEVLKRISLMGLSSTKLEQSLVDFFRKEHIKGNQTQQALAGISLLSLQERGHFTFKKQVLRPKQSTNPTTSSFITQK